MADERDDTQKRSLFDLKRRKFLKRVGMIGAGVALTDLILQHSDESVEAETLQLQGETKLFAADSTNSGEIPHRKLGRTGVEVSAIGLGGAHLGGRKSEEDAIRIIHEALDAGITFMGSAK